MKNISKGQIDEKARNEMMASAVYLQVSTISQALIFVTRSRGWSFMERPGFLLLTAFTIAQLVQNFNFLCSAKWIYLGETYIKLLHTEEAHGFKDKISKFSSKLSKCFTITERRSS